MVEKEKLEQFKEKGYLKVRRIIEMLGKPKDHVTETLKEFIEKMKSDEKEITLEEEFYSEINEEADSYFSCFAELLFWIKAIPSLVGFCFDYMPSSVEIEEPEVITATNSDWASMLNDLQAKLHNIDKIVKESVSQTNFLKKNFQRLLANTLLVHIAVHPAATPELAQLTGVPAKELQPFLDKLIEEKSIIEEEGMYRKPKKHAAP